MTRPDDVSAEAWERALDVIYEIGESAEHDAPFVARAIDAAIAKERERCAGIAAKHYDLRHGPHARFASINIAAAIRKGA